MQLTFNDLALRPGNILQFHGVNGSNFESFLNKFNEGRSFRVSYDNGMLEIMSPLAVHESGKKIISHFVEILFEELEVEYWPLGSTWGDKKTLLSFE